MEVVLSIDQGTTGTTVLLVDGEINIVARAYREFPQHFPQPGWVEHDPEEIWTSVVDALGELLEGGEHRVVAVGITNQRDTAVVWRRSNGEPVCRAIVWQCCRTAAFCEGLRDREEEIHSRSGLPVDSYFSASKWRWMLDHHPETHDSDVIFGTVDSWLIWKLTGRHVTDPTNASRTQLFHLEERSWDDELSSIFGVPLEKLPRVLPSSGVMAEVQSLPALKGVPLAGVAGDQQAALFGQGCYERGSLKNTYGTGAFLLMNTGSQRLHSQHGLISTLAIDGEGNSCHALEGSVFICGAAIQWLRDGLGLLPSADQSEEMAATLESNEGVYFVPALVGLGAPHWRGEVRGLISGITRETGPPHFVRAALESMAYQSNDLMVAMESDLGEKLGSISVDGGACSNDFFDAVSIGRVPKKFLEAQRDRVHLPRSCTLGRIGPWFFPQRNHLGLPAPNRSKLRTAAIGGTSSSFAPRLAGGLG